LLREIDENSSNDPTQIVSRVLSQRILDPAMGSGHFLVFALEHLADHVHEQLGRIRAEEKLKGKGKKKAAKVRLPVPDDASIELIRARIAERCIYGVDVNPLAVELAKLSLWIATAAKGTPLGFLNHHLRCGDSLLGVFSDEFHHDLFADKLVQQMKLAVEYIRQINESHSKTLKDIGIKEHHLRVAREHLRRFRLAFDSKLASDFGHGLDVAFHKLIDHIGDPLPEELPSWLQAVEKTASQYRFFHWELEFPEVWHDRWGRPLSTVPPTHGRPNAEERLAGFDAILGNPPFVKAKDESARRAYMERWETAIKGFHLLVPFFERAFQILRPDAHLGFIVSNAFAKREFGKKLVEQFLRQQRLEEVVDCSGLMFPGHGTPTCIVFARGANPHPAALAPPPEPRTIRVSATLKGDLRTPPEDSPLWQTIVAHHTLPRYRDKWIAVADLPAGNLAKHPWSFSAENRRTQESLDTPPHKRLRALLAEEIGYGCITRTDEVFIQPPWVLRRFRIELEHIRQLGIGESLRDWSHEEFPLIVFPYDATLRPFDPEEAPNTVAFVKPYKETLENVVMHGTVPKKETKIRWFEYSRLGRAKCRTPLSIAIPEIATHNHAYFDQSGVIFHQTAPALKLASTSSPEDHELLTAVLNSSAALFWLKQVCFNKGPGEEEKRDRFVYAGRKLEQLPIPDAVTPLARQPGPIAGLLTQLARACRERGRQLWRLSARRIFEKAGEAYDGWNRALPWYTSPHPLIAQPFDTAQELCTLKRESNEERQRLRREMIALQEEMDWLVYTAYGLLPLDHPAVGLRAMDAVRPWEVALGQRAFELAAIEAGPPADWEEKRKQLWLARMEAIRTHEHISRIEQPVYKRRWVPPDYEKEFTEAFKWWLREKAEFFLEHAANGGPISLEDWAAVLWTDHRVRAALQAFDGSPLASSKKFEPILREAIEEETVPDDETAFKSRHKILRGKLNVPRERFLSLTAKPGWYVWAGKKCGP
jgi:Eco57I restriction-modification methylase